MQKRLKTLSSLAGICYYTYNQVGKPVSVLVGLEFDFWSCNLIGARPKESCGKVSQVMFGP